MNKLITSCRRCLNPWVLGLIILAIIALMFFIPIIGVATLIAALPLILCTVMCGSMVFMMGKKK